MSKDRIIIIAFLYSSRKDEAEEHRSRKGWFMYRCRAYGHRAVVSPGLRDSTQGVLLGVIELLHIC